MAGIYFHIPFCIKKCGYCDFYSVTDLSLKQQFIRAVLLEINERKNELLNNHIHTIYFGGGTPSLLMKDDYNVLFREIFRYVDKHQIKEITIEVNPDDISDGYLADLKEIGFNRISIGTQSFNDDLLKFMNRRHNAEQAIRAVNQLQNSGFSNISVDLIYGIPGMNADIWKQTIDTVLTLNVQHISAYHLTFEQGTPFYKKLKSGEISELSDSVSVQQFTYLITRLNKAGFIDYEISNFALPGYESKHNSSYWTGENYVGFGPAAHSLQDGIRRWNVSDLKLYTSNIHNNEIYFSNEQLIEKDKYNELIMLSLRTRKGLEVSKIDRRFSVDILNHFYKELETQVENKNVYINSDFLKVCDDKKMITDQIISDFFIV